MIEHVADISDPRLDDYRNVPDPELIERRGIFVAEGRLVVRRLLTGTRMRPRSVMLTEAARAALQDVLDARPDVPVYLVPPSFMSAIVGFNIHRGCLAIGERPGDCEWRARGRSARRLVILERVGNADNVGAVFRNAAAFGVDAVLLERSCADPLYRKAIRTSMGAALALPFARIDAWPDALRTLRDNGAVVIGLTPAEHAPALANSLPSLADGRVAFVAGHEGEGLTDEAMRACDRVARIPMTSGVDSLNVATAIAIALYELTRTVPSSAFPVPSSRGSEFRVTDSSGSEFSVPSSDDKSTNQER
jgi:tRNA G18 (ribose-2'-O)-methylase SpoU